MGEQPAVLRCLCELVRGLPQTEVSVLAACVRAALTSVGLLSAKSSATMLKELIDSRSREQVSNFLNKLR